MKELAMKVYPAEISDKFSALTRLKSTADKAARNWRFKVSMFIAYCVDGGLLSSRFNIPFMLKILYQNEGDVNLREKLLKIIDYLLYLTPENVDHQYERLDVKAQKMVVKGGFIYNERVLRVLIEEDFIERQLLGSDNPQIFPKFLIKILSETDSYELQTSICRLIIKSQAEYKKNNVVSDTIRTAFNQLIGPVIDLYKSRNITLSKLAAVALVNLSSDSKESKQIIMQEGGAKISVGYLEARNEELLNFTLQLIALLTAIQSNLEVFLTLGLLKKLIQLLLGTGVLGTYYSDYSIRLIFQLIKAIANIGEDKKLEVQDYINTFLEVGLYKRAPGPYSEETHTEIVIILAKLAVKNLEIKKKIVKYYMDFMLGKIANKEWREVELIDRILYLMLILLKDNEELSENFKRHQLAKIFSELTSFGEDKVEEKARTIVEYYINPKVI